MSPQIHWFAIVVVLAFTAAGAQAESKNFKAGKWKFESTVTTPMMPAPQTSTETKCITEEVAKQDPLAELVEKGGCKVVSREQKGDTLHFEIECTGDAEGVQLKSRGKGEFTAAGDKASGKMELDIEMPEMPEMPAMAGSVKMTQSWKGERLGACD